MKFAEKWEQNAYEKGAKKEQIRLVRRGTSSNTRITSFALILTARIVVTAGLLTHFLLFSAEKKSTSDQRTYKRTDGRANG